uniref:uncharacterized protein LOC123464444 n=1 Tax=Jaculus jaculus TaxID=51337 RepID=UPI001E1B370F|nr:uncharacterized protein LOC123464444 [Jaculus jaculus]
MKALMLRGLILAFAICLQLSESQKSWQHAPENKVNGQSTQSSSVQTSQSRLPSIELIRNSRSLSPDSASAIQEALQSASSSLLNTQALKSLPSAAVLLSELANQGASQFSSISRTLDKKKTSDQFVSAKKGLKQFKQGSSDQMSQSRLPSLELIKKSIALSPDSSSAIHKALQSVSSSLFNSQTLKSLPSATALLSDLTDKGASQLPAISRTLNKKSVPAKKQLKQRTVRVAREISLPDMKTLKALKNTLPTSSRTQQSGPNKGRQGQMKGTTALSASKRQLTKIKSGVSPQSRPVSHSTAI